MENIQNKSSDPLIILWSRKWPIFLFTLVVTGTGISVCFYIPDEYEAKSSILVSPPTFNAEAQINRGLKPESRGFLSINNYKELVLTSGFLQGVIDRLIPKYPNIKSSLQPKTLEGMLRIDTGSHKVAERGHSTLMAFKIRGKDPILLKDIANIFPALLSEESRKMRAHEVETISQTTQTQYISTKKELDTLEQTLQNVRVKNHLHSVSVSLASKKLSLQDFEIELLKTKAALIEEESKLSSLSLMAQSKKYTNTLLDTKKQLGEILYFYSVRAEVNIKSLGAKQNFLSKSIAQLKMEIPELEDRVNTIKLQEEQLEREIDVMEASFLRLTSRYTETRIAEAEKTSDIRLVSNAIVPLYPIWPDRIKITVVSLVLGLVLGVAIALSKEHLDRKFK